MSDMENKKINVGVAKELAISEAERIEQKERVDRDKAIFAEALKKRLGEEMRTVLSEKKEIDTKPKKKNIIKSFFEKIGKICR